MKKKAKKQNKLLKGSLYISASFLLLFVIYFDTIKEKDNISLITYNENTVYTVVEDDELLELLDNGTGIILLINNYKYTNRVIKLLNDVKTDEKIYLYNIKNDETLLKLDKNENIKVVQKPSNFYDKLLSYLGIYGEEYHLEDSNEKKVSTEYKKIFTPMVIFIKEGKILLSHYIADDEIEDEELTEIYTKGHEMLEEYNL